MVLGVAGGWLFMQAILRRFFFRRLLGGFAGAVLGTCLGAMVLALRREPSAALQGIAWGTGIGAVVGPLLFLLFMGILRSLPRVLLTPPAETLMNDRGNCVDATFEKEDQGGKS